MKVALITDTHFGARGDNLHFNEYFFDFWEKQFFPHLEKNNIDTVIHLGDVMDRRKFVSYKIAKDFRERFIKRFHDMNINLYMITGNHDCYYKNTNEVNALDELIDDSYSTIKTYSECETIQLKDGTNIFLIPWINNENYDHTLNEINKTKADIAMGHLEIDGFEMHAGHKIIGGHPKEIFKKFDMVMSGHFHKKSDDGQVFYLGNTYEITWSDYNCPRGFNIFDTETRELEHVVNQYTIFEKIHYNDKKTDYKEFDVSKYKDKIVKIFVINKKNIFEFDKFVDRLLKESGAYEVKIIEDFSDLSPDKVSDEVTESQDTVSLLNRYVDELEIDFDKDRLKSIMKNLYLEASELEI